MGEDKQTLEEKYEGREDIFIVRRGVAQDLVRTAEATERAYAKAKERGYTKVEMIEDTIEASVFKFK